MKYAMTGAAVTDMRSRTLFVLQRTIEEMDKHMAHLNRDMPSTCGRTVLLRPSSTAPAQSTSFGQHTTDDVPEEWQDVYSELQSTDTDDEALSICLALCAVSSTS